MIRRSTCSVLVALALVGTTVTLGLVSPSRAATLTTYGPNDASYAAYYADWLNPATWAQFCSGAGDGATYSEYEVLGIPACGPTPTYGTVQIDIGPGSSLGGPPGPGSPLGGPSGPGFQCVEFAERYLWLHSSLAPLNGTNGGALVNNYATTYGLRAVKNGAHEAPPIGAVMSFASNSSFAAPDDDPGHVAVVNRDTVSSKTGGDGNIWVIGENQETYSKGYTDGESRPMLVKDWQIKSFDSHPDIEWFAPPSSPPSLAVLQGSDTAANDAFGSSMAISGTTAVVGAPGHANGAGRAYVFTKTPSGWTQTGELKGSGIVAHNSFGNSVSISGTTIVVAGGGLAFVFTKKGTKWPQVAELGDSDTVANGGFWSVAVSGDTIVVGSPSAAQAAGRAYVFTKTGNTWPQVPTAELIGSDTVGGDSSDDWFGASVVISGTTIVVGSPNHANLAGRAYVFTKQGRAWPQVTELEGSDTVAGDRFGQSVDISGTSTIVGAQGHAKGAGRVYVFTEKVGHWSQTAELEDSDPFAVGLGISVAISGTTIVAGDPGPKSPGASWVDMFTKTDNTWPRVPTAELEGSGTVVSVNFGEAVAVSGTSAVIGDWNASRAYVFEV